MVGVGSDTLSEAVQDLVGERPAGALEACINVSYEDVTERCRRSVELLEQRESGGSIVIRNELCLDVNGALDGLVGLLYEASDLSGDVEGLRLSQGSDCRDVLCASSQIVLQSLHIVDEGDGRVEVTLLVPVGGSLQGSGVIGDEPQSQNDSIQLRRVCGCLGTRSEAECSHSCGEVRDEGLHDHEWGKEARVERKVLLLCSTVKTILERLFLYSGPESCSTMHMWCWDLPRLHSSWLMAMVKTT